MRRRTYQRLKAASSAAFHHSVYVVLLHPRAARETAVLRDNPRRDPAKPCVYVGMTGLDPAVRFDNHKRGRKDSRLVRLYGIRLWKELYEPFNPMPFAAAVQMEKDLAEDLRAQGYTVVGGT